MNYATYITSAYLLGILCLAWPFFVRPVLNQSQERLDDDAR